MLQIKTEYLNDRIQRNSSLQTTGFQHVCTEYCRYITSVLVKLHRFTQGAESGLPQRPRTTGRDAPNWQTSYMSAGMAATSWQMSYLSCFI